MPLNPLLAVSSYASDASAVTLEDTTVYGGANAARADVATYVTVYKVDRSGELTELDLAEYDEATDSEYTATLPEDGWVQAWFAIVPDYNSGTTYNQYDVAYSGGVTYRSIAATPFSNQAPPNATYWEVILEPTSLIENVDEDEESNNLVWTLYDFVVSENTRIYAANFAADAAIEIDSNAKRSEEVLDYEFFYTQLDAMVGAGDRERFAEAERIARRVADEYAKLSS
jgi:hypothetical protein